MGFSSYKKWCVVIRNRGPGKNYISFSMPFSERTKLIAESCANILLHWWSIKTCSGQPIHIDYNSPRTLKKIPFMASERHGKCTFSWVISKNFSPFFLSFWIVLWCSIMTKVFSSNVISGHSPSLVILQHQVSVFTLEQNRISEQHIQRFLVQ